MAQYDAFPNPDGAGYLLDVQSDLLFGLSTRVVVPLLQEGHAPVRGKRLNPLFDIEGAPHSMVTQFVSALPETSLGDPVANLADHATQITDAIDFLLHGY